MKLKLPDPRALPRRAQRLARWTGSIAYRSVVVPLLELEETEHSLALACRLAARRGARIVLVAPLVVARELPLDAHFDAERAELERRLEEAASVVSSSGVTLRREIVRTRHGRLGEDVARVAAEHRAELLVVGAPVRSRRGFRRPFHEELLPLLRATPCRVLIATGPVAGTGLPGAKAEFTKILVPMKLGPIGDEIVATAVKLAQEHSVAVEAVHVIRVPLDQQFDAELVEQEEQAAASLAEAAVLGAEQGVQVEGRSIRARSIGEAIVQAAAESGADLIVLGSAPRWRRQARFFSPTVDYVLRKAPAEVLVLAFPQGVLEEA
ncbi:MAG TPA: universal stress protein [Gaiellaceae bacterium]|nr:universal stress protein [Gaiellaceae bacterium]